METIAFANFATESDLQSLLFFSAVASRLTGVSFYHTTNTLFYLHICFHFKVWNFIFTCHERVFCFKILKIHTIICLFPMIAEILTVFLFKHFYYILNVCMCVLHTCATAQRITCRSRPSLSPCVILRSNSGCQVCLVNHLPVPP